MRRFHDFFCRFSIVKKVSDCTGGSKCMISRSIARICSTMTKVTGDGANSSVDTALHKVHSGRVEEGADKATIDTLAPKREKTNRYAMLLGYQGKNYFGMQVQRGNGSDVCPTIEGHVLTAMHSLGWINDALLKTPFDFFFQRAARTDKAVSAVRQMISCQLPVSLDLPNKGADAINEKLPDDIRVFGFRRTTKNFHSQKNCDGRTYSYTLPTFAFAKPHELTNASYRVSKETLEEVRKVLSEYKGTRNYFNYTSGRSFADRSCHRYIISFDVGEPFLFRDEFRNEDVEFVTCVVKGQSFMLHQIRKMIGMMITVVRELHPITAVNKSFTCSNRMDVPKAPGLGLLLERLHYGKYDKQFGCKEPFLPLSDWGPDIEKAIEELRTNRIVSEILKEEITSQSMMQWLSDLIHHNFEDESGKVVDFVTGAAKRAALAQKEQESAVNEGTGDEEVQASSEGDYYNGPECKRMKGDARGE